MNSIAYARSMTSRVNLGRATAERWVRYDCEFVSVAMRLGVKLLTVDKKVLMALPAHTLQFSAT